MGNNSDQMLNFLFLDGEFQHFVNVSLLDNSCSFVFRSLSFNQFSGPIPAWIGSFPALLSL